MTNWTKIQKLTRVIFLSKYSVLNGEVVERETGKKARGKFKIKEGKNKISIYKISEKTGKEKFVGFSTKMGKKIQKVAEKLQKTRIVRATNKAKKQGILSKYAKDEYERSMIQKKEYEEKFEDEDTVRIRQQQEDYRLKFKKEKGSLSRQAIKDIGTAKRSSPDLYGMMSKESQNMVNFERILTAMENDGTLSLDKINNLIEKSNTGMFSELDDGAKGMFVDYLKLLPSQKFESVEDFSQWIFNLYMDNNSQIRTALWDMLHSFYPEQGYTYNPLSI